MKQREFCVAAPVSSPALCNDSFSEPCGCEETWNSALAGAVSWNVPPTPPIFCLLKCGGNRRRIFSFLFWFVIKEIYSSSRWGPEMGTEWLGRDATGRWGSNCSVSICRARNLPLLASFFFSLSNSDKGSLRMI